MNTLIKLLIIISLLLTPYSGSAAMLEHESESTIMQHSMMAADQATQTMDAHDCCDDQTVASSPIPHQQCDNSCGDCQHHCSSSATGLIALMQLPVQYHPLAQWPHSQGVPLSRQDNQIRPPMSA